jgi:aminopeptidase N
MVIGVSPFAVDRFESSSGIPLSSWVFPQNREDGFYDYRIADRPMKFFEEYIAPFPYSKLANVQSRTIYGGMENASCIFYREGSVTGKRKNETLFAHEIAHQWFGDAVTEENWHHIWLSEGFATYFTDLYLEQAYGKERFLESLKDERSQVIRYSYRRLAPVVDTTLDVSVELLSPNSYEKAGWVLHMLRHELGDSLFRECIRAYFIEFQHRNALTEDFIQKVHEVSGKDLQSFFRQWLYEPGHPVISAQWNSRGKRVDLMICQHQETPCPLFYFPMEVEWQHKDGTVHRETLHVQSAAQRFSIKLPFRPRSMKLDPDCRLLFEVFRNPAD